MSDLESFRSEVRHWLEQNCPESQRQPIVRDEQIWGGRQRRFPSDDAQLWFERMRDKGWTAPDWPVAFGGGGLDPARANILSQEMRRLKCRPPLYESGLWMLGPALLEFGTDEQKQEHLPKIVRGEIRWCQGYSEPGAGSELAGLQMRAEEDGDEFVLNGSKIWTTAADLSDWIFCLVRTDPHASKQAGISFLLVDMETPGISVAPIKLISGDSEFCQTFFDNVRVPKRNLVGKQNEGWTVAKALLRHERKLMAMMDDMVEKNDRDLVEVAREYVGSHGNGELLNHSLRERIAEQRMRERALKLCEQRIFLHARARSSDGGLAMIMKYAGTSSQQHKDALLLDILGDRGLSLDDENLSIAERRDCRNWAFNKSLTIAGGTSEVQLNIIARKALALPSNDPG